MFRAPRRCKRKFDVGRYVDTWGGAAGVKPSSTQSKLKFGARAPAVGTPKKKPRK